MRWVRVTVMAVALVMGLQGVASGEPRGPTVVETHELGTLGGEVTQVYAINDRGQVAGWSTTSGNDQHAIVWDARRGMRDLGTLGGPWSVATEIGGTGVVVGRSATVTGEVHAFAWSAGTGMRDIGTLGGTTSEAVAVNDRGQVAGSATTPAGFRHAFFWDPRTGIVDLGTLSGDDSFAMAINDAGQVTGNSAERVFLWSRAAGMRDLGTAGGSFSGAVDLNNRGQVAATGQVASGDTHAIRWDARNGWVDLGALGAPPAASYAYAINAKGAVVGESAAHAFFWTARSGMHDLGAGQALAVNDRGMAVGTLQVGDGVMHGFAWIGGVTVDLGSLAGPTGWSFAYDVNSKGQIVGWSAGGSGGVVWEVR